MNVTDRAFFGAGGFEGENGADGVALGEVGLAVVKDSHGNVAGDPIEGEDQFWRMFAGFDGGFDRANEPVVELFAGGLELGEVGIWVLEELAEFEDFFAEGEAIDFGFISGDDAVFSDDENPHSLFEDYGENDDAAGLLADHFVGGGGGAVSGESAGFCVFAPIADFGELIHELNEGFALLKFYLSEFVTVSVV